MLYGARRLPVYIRPWWIFVAAYLACACLAAVKLSLWVDEILQLIGTRDAAGMRELMHWIAINPGNVPLGYLTQSAAIHMLSPSNLAARLPSLVFSVFACGGVIVVSRQLGLGTGRACFASLVFAMLPLQFRYATEARPYSEALAFAVFSSAAFINLFRKRTWSSATIYSLLLALGLYTQPFSFFVAIGHLVWVVTVGHTRDTRRPRLLSIVAMGAACAAFLPWLLWVRQEWKESIGAGDYTCGIGPRTLSMLFRELPGSYFAAAVLLIAIARAFCAKTNGKRPARVFLLATIVVPVVCALCADALFGYFVSVRQMIFALPGAAILAADGAVSLMICRARLGGLLIAALFTSCLAQDIRMLTRPREDWQDAAARILAEAGPGDCVSVVPEQWAPLYSFFQPSLKMRTCPGNAGPRTSVVLAVTPYTRWEVAGKAQARLIQRGFVPQRTACRAGGSLIQVFTRQPSR